MSRDNETAGLDSKAGVWLRGLAADAERAAKRAGIVDLAFWEHVQASQIAAGNDDVAVVADDA